MDMLFVLRAAEQELPILLHDGRPWNSLLVDYHPPVVERLWRQWGEYRISLHRIHPCKPEEALFHPHPWASAVRLLDGKYEMTVGHRTYDNGHRLPPPVAARITLSAPDTYEMTDPGGWHAVRPLDRPSLSVMVSGKPLWSNNETAIGQLKPLNAARARNLLALFQNHHRVGRQS